MNFFMRIKEVISKMFGKKQIAETVGADIVVSDKMLEAIKLWSDLYADNAPWLNKDIKSKNLSASIAREMARLVTLELRSELTGSARADYLSPIYSKLISDAPTFTEYACAKGGIMLKPYITPNGIATAYSQADSFYPTSYNAQGEIVGCIFVERYIRGGKYYTRLESHDYSLKAYVITNVAYVSDYADDLGRKISLQSVAEWQDLVETTTLVNIKRPLFAYFKMPGANRIDNNSPLGVSVYANAVNAIKEADIQYSRLLWEFEGAELAVYADYTALSQDGEKDKMYLPKLSDRLYRGIDGNTDKLIEVFSPEIREQSLLNGLDELLRNVEFLSGLAYGTLSTMTENAKTATEIKVSKERSYSTIDAIQKSLQKALTEYLEVLNILCDLYKLAPQGNVEQSFSSDDSFINDKETEQKILFSEVSAGLITPEYYLMQTKGFTEEQANEMLSKVKVFDDGNDE